MTTTNGHVIGGAYRIPRLPAATVTTAIRERLHPVMLDYLDGVFLRGRDRTAVTISEALSQYQIWLNQRQLDPLRVTGEQMESYQDFLMTTYRTARGQPLARSTVSMRITFIRGWYAWLLDRGHLVVDPSRHLGVRVPESRVVVKEYLTLQEATALVQTQAARVAACRQGTMGRVNELRTLAAVCLTLATGRRVSGVCGLTVAQVDLDRNELRVEREKGQIGRVLPVAAWAMEVVRWYLTEARSVLVRGHDVPWLFVDLAGSAPAHRAAFNTVLHRLVQATIAANPDLTDLPAKQISWHSLRVSFATLLFQNGCDIRSVNELLLHSCLSTTAKYTPVPVEDLRQVFRTAHPRA